MACRLAASGKIQGRNSGSITVDYNTFVSYSNNEQEELLTQIFKFAGDPQHLNVDATPNLFDGSVTISWEPASL